MNDKVEKIAKKLYQIHWGVLDASIDAEWAFAHPKAPWQEKAQKIHQLYLSDPNIVEIDPDAEMPDTALSSEEFKELDRVIIADMEENWRLGGRRPTAEYASRRLAVLTARKQDAKTRAALKAGWVLPVKVEK